LALSLYSVRTGPPQDGHSVGRPVGGSSPVRISLTTLSTWGMISPAFCTSTWSPTRTSLRSTSSKLCSEARLTVVPESWTGSSSATGVIWPLLPTFSSISRTWLTCCSAANL
jgi:hypothetical protein